MRSFRGTLALLLVALALGVGLYFTGGDPEPSGEITESVLDGRPLLSARRITIRGQLDVQPIELERGDTLTFRMVEPLRDMASVARLHALAVAWDTARLVKAYEPSELTPDLLEQTGLDRPRAELTAEFDDGSVKIELGQPGPLGHTVFVRKNGVVYQTGRAAVTTLEGTPDDYRERRIFTNPVAAVRSVSITRYLDGERTRLSFRRLGAGRYQLTEPLTARADPGMAEAVVNSLMGLTASSFARGNVLPQPEQPDATIEISGGAGTETVRLWSQPAEMMLGHQSPRELDFVLPAAMFRRLFELPVDALRSGVLIHVPPDRATEIRLEYQSGERKPIVLRRGAQQYLELREPVRSPAQSTAVGKLLEGLRLLTAIEFVDAKPDQLAEYGLESDYVTLSVAGPLDPRPDVVHVSRPRGDRCYARRADEPYVVAIPLKCGEALQQPWTAYVERTVYSGVPDQVTAVRYRSGEVVQEYRKGADGAWRREGSQSALDDFAETVAELADLKAESVVESGVVRELGEPIEVELRAGDAVLQTFSVWRQGKRALVKVPRLDAVFRLGGLASSAILAWAP